MNRSQVYDPHRRRVLPTIVVLATVTGLLSPPGRTFARAVRTHPFFGTIRACLGVAQSSAYPFSPRVAR
jgi:hypothetical protein